MDVFNDFERQMLIYRINNLRKLGNKDFMISFAGIVNDYALLQKEDYKNLQDHEWCRDSFRHEYTVIKALSKDVAEALVKDKKDNTGRQRYYDNIFYLGGSNYLLSSEWYDGKGKKLDNKTSFINWLENLIYERFQINESGIPLSSVKIVNSNYTFRPYITAIKSKPFLLLAGISGTGKSRIVRELARACWEEGTEEYRAQKPRNFEMIQVKPNWHDSSELIGYVSRVSGEPVFVAGDFLRFVAKAWENVDVPHFLCLDEMNLAPVEQYFAEYLSVIESRKNKDGEVVTDAILEKCSEQWYYDLMAKLTNDEEVRTRFLNEGITLPKNLIVVGTVNMDETTFSFSRKVLDRAMTIEMNEVDLGSGLDRRHERIGLLGEKELTGTAVEGVDVYENNREVCEQVIKYLTAINGRLENTPFKIAYRTRNEALLYVVNNLPYHQNENGEELPQAYVIARALDEITNMKILSRIEGDETKIGNLLNDLNDTIEEQLTVISEETLTKEQSVSLAKLKEMKERLKQGYTSFWG